MSVTMSAFSCRLLAALLCFLLPLQVVQCHPVLFKRSIFDNSLDMADVLRRVSNAKHVTDSGLVKLKDGVIAFMSSSDVVPHSDVGSHIDVKPSYTDDIFKKPQEKSRADVVPHKEITLVPHRHNLLTNSDVVLTKEMNHRTSDVLPVVDVIRQTDEVLHKKRDTDENVNMNRFDLLENLLTRNLNDTSKSRIVLPSRTPPLVVTPNQSRLRDYSRLLMFSPRGRALTSQEQLERTNRAFDRVLRLVSLLGQVDGYLSDQARLAVRKLSAMYDEEDRFKRGH